MLVTLLVVAARGGVAVAPGDLRLQLVLLGITAGFFIGFWSRDGQTLGMRAWRLRVVGPDGRPPRPAVAGIRFVVGALSFGLGGAGLLWRLLDRDGLTWYDRAAGTRVVAVPRER